MHAGPGPQIWYIFPQLRGLGRSSNSWIYGLADLDEAKAYLAHNILGRRLRDITAAALAHAGKEPIRLMGSGIDSHKLKSSMTLFDAASPRDIFEQVLDAFFEGRRDAATLKKVR